MTQARFPALHECRPEVLAFARLMELKLRKHDDDYGRAGWKDWNLTAATIRLQGEVMETVRAINTKLMLPTEEAALAVASETADVANFGMMIADMCGTLEAIAADPGRPKVVCLCGSTRFSAAFREANLRETLAGNIVLSIGCDMRSDDDVFGHMTEADKVDVKARLDGLHMCKIDLADEVLILNVGGYIGESTRNELNHARAKGKAVRFWESQTEAGD